MDDLEAEADGWDAEPTQESESARKDVGREWLALMRRQLAAVRLRQDPAAAPGSFARRKEGAI